MADSRAELTKGEIVNLMDAIRTDNGYRNTIIAVNRGSTLYMNEMPTPRIDVLFGKGTNERMTQNPSALVFDHTVELWIYIHYDVGTPVTSGQSIQDMQGESLLQDVKRALSTKWVSQMSHANAENGNRWMMDDKMEEQRWTISGTSKGFIVLKGTVGIFAVSAGGW